MKTKKLLWIALAFSTAFLAACGGGSDGANDDVTTANPTGIWTGSTSTGRSATGVVLGDGTYYVLYSQVGVPEAIAGVLQGRGSTSGSTFSSVDGKDFNFEEDGVFDATVAATVSTQQAFNGTISYSLSGQTRQLTTNHNPISASPASLSAVQGTYSGNVMTSAGSESAELVVSSIGSFSGTGSSGCAVGGSVTHRTDVNAYDISVSFGPSPCLFANQTFSGVAILDGNLLRAAAPNNARTDGILFVGNRT